MDNYIKRNDNSQERFLNSIKEKYFIEYFIFLISASDNPRKVVLLYIEENSD
jgi:hypothetical protein